MKSISLPAQLQVIQSGEAAWDILKSKTHGQVFAICSNVVYLKSSDDDLFWLVTEDIPMHRRAIQVSDIIPSVSIDTQFNFRNQHLHLGHIIDLDLSHASRWISPQSNPAKILPFEFVPDRLWSIAQMFEEFPKPSGFGALLLEFVNRAMGHSYPATIPTPGLAVKHGLPAFVEIVEACFEKDYSRILKTAEDIIGLGEGLTPSGDDFVGGLLFANISLQEIYPKYQGLPPSDVDFFIDYLRDRTNLISSVLLKDLAIGSAFETVHRFINNLLTYQNLEQLKITGLELVRIGHSTGWDILTGIWIGMLLSFSSKAALTKKVKLNTKFVFA